MKSTYLLHFPGCCHSMHRWVLDVCRPAIAVDGKRKWVEREEIDGIQFGGCRRDVLYRRLSIVYVFVLKRSQAPPNQEWS
jgi:hypothetical protein